METESTIELRSEEVQELLTSVPHWMIRWGNVVILTILLLTLLMSWFIKYPDIVTANLVITTNTPPERLVAKASGRIIALLVPNLAVVKANTPLAIIESTANYKHVWLLKQEIEHYEKSHLFNFSAFQNSQFGEIESSFAQFQKEYVADSLNKKLHPYSVERLAQSSEKSQIQNRLNLLIQQKTINESELALQRSELKRNQLLFDKGIIAAQEIEHKKLAFLQAEKNYKGLLSSISQLKSSIIDNDRNHSNTAINETKENSNLERSTFQSLDQLKKVIKDWEMNYVIQSSIAGKVTFLQIWTVNQVINSGDNAFSVIPSVSQGYIGKVKAVAQNSGKITVGQKVNIRLVNFPDREFGTIEGKIKTISLVPDKDGNLLIDVSLPKGLETTYKKKITFQQEMSGTADIVTEDLRLIERLLYQFRDFFNKREETSSTGSN